MVEVEGCAQMACILVYHCVKNMKKGHPPDLCTMDVSHVKCF